MVRVKVPVHNDRRHLVLLRLVNVLAVGIFFSIVLQLIERGADYGAYQAWTSAGALADVRAPGESLPVSVQGVPFSHWVPAGGLVAVPVWFIATYLEQPDRSLLWTGAACIGCFWLSFWRP